MSERHQNINCLAGLKCPKCGSLGPFEIQCSVVAVVHDDGTDEGRDHEWNDDSLCICHDGTCAFQGKVADFKTDRETGMFCHDLRHETPCPLPCEACEEECDKKTWKKKSKSATR